MKKFPSKVEFYITNVCNLTCENCNRFNNHKFTGWQRWSDYESIYTQWAKHIELSAVVLMGGEPTLNPSINDWLSGIPRVFGCNVQLLTNGTRLNQTPGLYKTLADLGRNAHVGISLHNINDFESIRTNVKSFLQGTVVEWGTWINVPCPAEHPDFKAYWSAADSNNVLFNLWINNEFSTASVQLSNNKFILHDSDPIEAHSICGFVKYKSYHFIKGKLYKCGPVALWPEFDQQNTLDISHSDRQLINSYQPLSMENYAEYHEEFFANLDNPLPQCKFCPVAPTNTVIYPVRKGSA